ncbi:hypothetical protein QEH52_11040 [Coraliomargarita sp. SDUM461003]|uniref:Uncharacterized protein n=1 Tax=Thalassobacterium maritimum TaxID=3041265 RepID=A0ABU1AV68_9BACT|nr:hypothetical protein [Coraliomargarita sp. SDUM461003]MDQ8208046.1 hypothetical protein [Coraliomargarita sp. SDUM461003]
MNKQLSFLLLTLLSYCQLQAKVSDISLTPENWETETSTILKPKGSSLTAKSMNSSIWLSPRDQLEYGDNLSAQLKYALRSGNLVVQANWFNDSGEYLKTTELHRTNSEATRTQFEISKPIELNDNASYYRLKLWVEADMPNLQIEAFAIVASGDQNQTLLKSRSDFEPSTDISIHLEKDGALQLDLINPESVQSVHTKKRYSIEEQGQLHLHLDHVTSSSAFSMQLLLWDGSGSYKGYIDVIKDATTPQITHINLTDYDLPHGSMHYSIKLWLSGNAHTSAELRIAPSK